MITIQQEPQAMVELFYKALYGGDMKQLKTMMTQKSYFMTLESFGIRLSFKDASFKKALQKIEVDKGALVEVEHKLSQDLKERKKKPQIYIVLSVYNGTERQTVHYTEDGKNKVLHFSKESDGWKINYYAGRKVA